MDSENRDAIRPGTIPGSTPELERSCTAQCDYRDVAAEREDWERRFRSLEENVKSREREREESISILKECICVRDEQLEVAREEIRSKDAIIENMREQIVECNSKIEKLTQLVVSLKEDTEQRKSEKSTVRKNDQSKRRTLTYKPMSLEETFSTPAFNRFYIMRFAAGIKRDMCPFEFEKSLIAAIGSSPESITAGGRDGFIVKVRSAQQGMEINKITEIDGKGCNVQEHTFFNETKGVINIYNSDVLDLASFAEGLKIEYGFTKVERADWMSRGNSTCKSFILSTNSEQLPTYIRITGENQLTRVYPFKDKPMRCTKCQTYGHTVKRCNSSTSVCGKCSDNHPTDECTTENMKCANCEGQHRAGSRDCPVRKKEDEILDIQAKMKVGRSEAKKIADGNVPSTHHEAKSKDFGFYFKIQLQKEKQRQVCPFRLENELRNELKIPRTNINTDRNSLVVRCNNEQQKQKVANVKNICGIPCRVTEHESYNHTKAIIYIGEFHIGNLESFTRGLKAQHNVISVEQAHWIRPKNQNSRPFLITFCGNNLPESLRIPGERANVPVYEYRPRPPFCQNCLQYTHSTKSCQSGEIHCKKCSGPHLARLCVSETVKCYYCGAPHMAGSKQCPKQLQEEEIVSIQYKQKISLRQARQQFFDLFPDRLNSFKKISLRQKNAPTPAVETERADSPSCLNESTAREDATEETSGTPCQLAADSAVPSKRSRDEDSEERFVHDGKRGRMVSGDSTDDGTSDTDPMDEIAQTVRIFDEFTHQVSYKLNSDVLNQKATNVNPPNQNVQ